VLTFFIYDEAHRRALEWPRLEFRGAAESVATGRISQRRNRPCHQQQAGRARIGTREARGIETRLIPSKGLEREAYDRQVARPATNMRWI